MSLETIKFDMYSVGDRMLEQVYCDATVNTETGEITEIKYHTESHRRYVEGLGAPGTADYWLEQARSLLEEEWEDYIG